jgi:hypothetical protein
MGRGLLPIKRICLALVFSPHNEEKPPSGMLGDCGRKKTAEAVGLAVLVDYGHKKTRSMAGLSMGFYVRKKPIMG